MRQALPLCTVLALSFACGEPAKKPEPKKDAKVDTKDAKATKEAVKDPEPPAEYAWDLPRGLKAPEVPADNPMTKAKVELGHQLFFDKRLSVDGSRSCYSCHQNELGNADGRQKALGPGDKVLARNTPTIWNVAYFAESYWDGRAKGLEKQMLGAWKGGNMGVGEAGLAAKAAEIGALPEYKDAFKTVFGVADGEAVKPEQVAQAVSAYERTLLCGGTAWDTNSLDEPAKRGWELFRGKAACSGCHTGDNLSDGLYHLVGVGVPDTGDEGDKGRFDASKADADKFKFRTPTLRNVARTAPYFHDGSEKDLESAVRLMAKGGNRKVKRELDANLLDRGLSDAEIKDIVAFLRALDCPGKLEVIGDQTVAGIPEAAGDAKAGDAKAGDAKAGDAKADKKKAG